MPKSAFARLPLREAERNIPNHGLSIGNGTTAHVSGAAWYEKTGREIVGSG
jgi:hypothetical protein